MRAVFYQRYGGPEVLEVGTLPDPPAPGRGEVEVRVSAAALNPKDVLVRKGKFTIFTRKRFPRVPGYDVAGHVARVGPGVRRLREGDRVFGMIQSWDAGACAERVTMPADELALAPEALSDAEAAALPLAALTALQALRDLLEIRGGERLLINGASGGVGVYAVQLAAAMGAHVVGVCSSRNVERVAALGADEVIPYDEADPLEAGPFDAAFDVFGNRPAAALRPALAPRARFCTTIPSPRHVLRDLLTRFGARPERLVVVRSNASDLNHLADRVRDGSLRPVIDRVLPLEDSAEAHAYIETRRARGKIVLTL